MTSNKNINNKNKNNHSKNNIPAHSVDTRELALEMLIEINERGAFSHIVLRSVLDKYQYLSKQDRAFMTRLVDGTIEYMLQLDYIIDSFSKTKVRKMKPFIRNLLRMSVYQIKYMDAVPDSAVCNEAVKLAKRHKFAQLSGFVNGVLRNIARNIDSVQFDTLSIRYSMPQWIVDRFVSAYGEKKAEEIFKAFHNKSTISIRTNLTRCTPDELRAKLEAEGVTVTAVDELNYAFVISGFDYLNGKEFWDINKASFGATVKAHREKLPCLILEVERLDAYVFGELFYFFLFSCYVSARILGVNPFDQPGVEAYKKWMFEALGKDRKIS